MAFGRTTAAAVRPETTSKRKAALPEVLDGSAIGCPVIRVTFLAAERTAVLAVSRVRPIPQVVSRVADWPDGCTECYIHPTDVQTSSTASR